jgi:hypothetical protein
MSESDQNQMREKSWRRRPSGAEESELKAWLANHPEAQADWETDIRLTEALNRLPDTSVPSNFTARVVRAVERESAITRPRALFGRWSLGKLLPRAAVAAVIMGAVLLTYHERNIAERRAELVQSVKMVSGVPSLPSPDILQDFDTIQKMGTEAGPDQELIALMQ